ncbi:MAG: hypothetical protein ACOCVN_01290, partial [bacterium]
MKIKKIIPLAEDNLKNLYKEHYNFQLIKNELEKDLIKINLSGLAGSSLAAFTSSLFEYTGKRHLFIMPEKEEA